jgi:hypothetical protein
MWSSRRHAAKRREENRMWKVTDALIVVDVAKVLADHGTAASDSYTPLQNNGLGYVFMVAPWLDVSRPTGTVPQAQQAQTYQAEEGGNQLKLAVAVGDVARFRSRPLGGPGDYQCFIDKIVAGPQANACMTAFTPACRAIATTELDPTVPPFTKYAPVPGHDYCWEATMLLAGTVQYTVDFSIYDAAAKKQGGFTFQSQVSISA